MSRRDKQIGYFHNPLTADSPDPWLVWHEGWYYFLCSSHEHIAIKRARSIVDIYDAGWEIIWTDKTPSRCLEFWAPEIHRLKDETGRLRWYLYYCASDGHHMNHRCHVLESAGETPAGPWMYKGQLQTDPDDKLYAIDAGVVNLPDGRLYFVWAGNPGHRLFISAMRNPWTTAGERTLLEADGFGCAEVREGPVAVIRGGKVFLFYSTCDTGKPDYKCGMLVADVGSELTEAGSWRQHPEPVLVRSDKNKVFGPGHNGFFVSPDGKEVWIIYHAKTTPMYTYRMRNARAQKLDWTPEGTPYVKEALGLDAVIEVPGGDVGGDMGPKFA